MINTQQIKIVIMGEGKNKYWLSKIFKIKGRVGKTSIITKYFSNRFDEKEEMTINSCFVQKNYNYKDKNFKFSIWVKLK